MEETSEHIAIRVSVQTLIVNAVLTAFKTFAGLAANSAAMISDALHSASDIISTVIVMIGVKIANQKADKEHPYGHERFECVAAIILSVILAATGLNIGWAGVKNIMAGYSEDLGLPGSLALVAAVVSIVVKEAMYWYTRAAAKKIDSSALMADAWHHRSDALSSVGAFAGILCAILFGLPSFDFVASILICILILKASFDIFRDAIDKMTDKACPDEMIAEFTRVVLVQKDVLSIHRLRTRLFGDRIYIDVDICADGDLTLREAHAIAQRVHDAIETNFPKVKHCMVHVNPRAW